MKVEVLGAATTKFGELWEKSPRDLVKEAVSNSLKRADIGISSVEAIFVGNMLSGILGGQEHLGAFFAEELGVNVPAVKIEGACASGGLAVHAAVSSLSSQYGTVLVVGIEKMTDYKPEEVAYALMGAGEDSEREAGATFPALYALMARSHMEEYSTHEKDLACVAVKNHFHASLNSHAQFPFQITLDQVLQSPVVSSPLKLYDCSPISDGAAAVILSRKQKAESRKRKRVSIVASAVATDSLGLAQREELTSLKAAKLAADKAYKQAGISPQDIDVAEVHDCFTIAEIIAMEDLGFYQKGEAARGISNGETRVDRERPKNVPIVNTSGGLKAAGHPVGATGVKQIVEIYEQLKKIAGKKQVDDARVGLTHNVGGSGATVVVHILRR